MFFVAQTSARRGTKPDAGPPQGKGRVLATLACVAWHGTCAVDGRQGKATLGCRRALRRSGGRKKWPVLLEGRIPVGQAVGAVARHHVVAEERMAPPPVSPEPLAVTTMLPMRTMPPTPELIPLLMLSVATESCSVMNAAPEVM